MTPRARIAAVWAGQEVDRVPIEIGIHAAVREHPRARELCALVDAHADNFTSVPGPEYGFLGLPATQRREVVEESPAGVRKRTVVDTGVGEFVAVTWHPADNPDYHWEERYLRSIDDLRRVNACPRPPLSWDAPGQTQRLAEIGESAYPLVGLFHPLGTLVRQADMEEVYAWLATEGAEVHRYLAAANEQLIAAIEGMAAAGMHCEFMTWAHEMLIAPWLGVRQWDEFVAPYDRELIAAIHRVGGRIRIHCHGAVSTYLERFLELGVDSMEPLELPPYGDIDLADAKRRIGERMLLSGGLNSQNWVHASADQVREEVKSAIRQMAKGGRFTLKPSGAGPLTRLIAMSREAEERDLDNFLVYMQTALEFGRYG